MSSLTRGAARQLRAGEVRQSIVEMDTIFLFSMSVNDGSVLAVVADAAVRRRPDRLRDGTVGQPHRGDLDAAARERDALAAPRRGPRACLAGRLSPMGDKPIVRSGGAEADETEVEETYAVRPYAVTGGRTRASSADLPLEALVQSLRAPVPGMTAETIKILDLTAVEFLSIAELSAHVKLPVGVVRVIVSDLADEGKVRIHGIANGQAGLATSLSVLESVLNGISSL